MALSRITGWTRATVARAVDALKRGRAPGARRTVAAAFGAAFLFTCVMAFWPGLKGLPVTDTTQHAAAFSVLTMLSIWLLPSASQLILGGALCSFGGLIEFVQELPFLHRTADIGDWTVDVIAVAGVLAVAALLRGARAIAATAF